MLIGIWGPSAVGKTTWLTNIMDELPNLNTDLVVVFGDLAEEYHYLCTEDAWLLQENKLRWQGTREEKLQWPVDQLIADDKVWILESMRWFNGLQPLLVDSFISNSHKGLAMLIPYAQPAVHKKFIKQRCDFRNKKMSPWWTPENCWKESSYRINSVEKYWKPAGVPHHLQEIDSNRRNWNIATDILKTWLGG